MAKTGYYIVFDGMDGSGKGTQLELLQQRFAERVVFTREPGGAPFAEKIRGLVCEDPLAGASTPLNNLLLFWAAREDLVHHVVMPALVAGKNVFSDRGYSSTFAYQICGEEQRSLRDIFFMLRAASFDRDGRQRPDLHIVYDVPAEVARERAVRDVGRKVNHFDERPLGYYQRVREGFGRLAMEHEVVKFVDATRAPEDVHAETLAILSRFGIE